MNEATGTTPTASAQAWPPPSSETSAAAASAERVSFHSRAGRTTSPASSRQTMPCCWPPTDSAATSDSPPAAASASVSAASQAAGSTSVPAGCAARPSRTSSPESASRTTTLQAWVELSTPATSGTGTSWVDGSRVTQTIVQRPNEWIVRCRGARTGERVQTQGQVRSANLAAVLAPCGTTAPAAAPGWPSTPG